MVKFSYHIDQTEYNRTVPTKWSELTIRGLNEVGRIDSDDKRVYLSVLSSTPMDHIEAFPNDLTLTLCDAISFVWDELVFVESACPYEFKPLGELQVNQFEHWRIRPSVENTIALLHSGPYSYTERMELIDSILEMPADIGLYWQNSYIKEFELHRKKFAPLYEPREYTEDELNAGFDELAKWGVYSTYEELAQSDILRMDSVAKLGVDEVYYFLLYKKQKMDCINKLNEYAIQRTKRNH